MSIGKNGVISGGIVEGYNKISVYKDDIVVNENLLKNTAFKSNYFQYVTLDNNMKFNGMPSLRISRSGLTSNAYTGYDQNISGIKAGDTVTVSVWIYKEDGMTFDNGYEMRIYQRRSDGTTNWTGFAPSSSTWTAGKWFKCQYTYTLDSLMTEAHFSMNVVKNGTYWLSSPKVEFGSKATPWCPNSADGYGTINQTTVSSPMYMNQIIEY